jgi:hypothetical protein
MITGQEQAQEIVLEGDAYLNFINRLQSDSTKEN